MMDGICKLHEGQWWAREPKDERAWDEFRGQLVAKFWMTQLETYNSKHSKGFEEQSSFQRWRNRSREAVWFEQVRVLAFPNHGPLPWTIYFYFPLSFCLLKDKIISFCENNNVRENNVKSFHLEEHSIKTVMVMVLMKQMMVEETWWRKTWWMVTRDESEKHSRWLCDFPLCM